MKKKLIINYNYVTLIETKGKALKWYNSSKKNKIEHKIEKFI